MSDDGERVEASTTVTTLAAVAAKSDYKVRGKKTAANGAAVQGHNTSTSGVAYGLEGVTDSTEPNASGVHGLATAGSGPTYGVLGRGNSPSTQGVVGASISGSLGEGEGGFPAGVWGVTDRSTSDADVVKSFGVYGQSAASGTDTYGVYGTVNSTAPGAYGVFSDGPSRTNGTHEVQGAVDASEGYRGPVGSSAYREFDWNITSTTSTVPFNRTHANQRGEFDKSNHYFECAYDGTYAMEFGLDGAGSTTGEVAVHFNVEQGTAGSNPAGSQALTMEFSPPDGESVSRTFSKTIYGLVAGNRLSVSVGDSAASLNGAGGANNSFLTIRQVGGGGRFINSI